MLLLGPLSGFIVMFLENIFYAKNTGFYPSKGLLPYYIVQHVMWFIMFVAVIIVWNENKEASNEGR